MIQVSKLAWTMALSTSMLIACNGGRESTQDQHDSTTRINTTGNLQDGASKMEEVQAKLKNITKLTNEELKAFFPEDLNGWRRAAYSGGNQAYGVDVASGQAVYEAPDDKELMLTLTDGAGETGAAVVSLMAMSLTMDAEKDSEYEVTKNKDVQGYRASTRETKPQQEGSVVDSDITFVYKDRYLVKLEGDGFKLDELKDIVGKLNLSVLQ
ncbi:hypothetical protein [Sphingobacterium paludis]|uniref:Lipoprotein n=1 Tax=Sphingobacterium paludis TaxID=1476465 RepID=A0A4R7D257_9SPHI|nr:hypothetical protein [Sphingobacterium paludis]TDS12876.1 hypothetical protein B0I21_1057 [Sphingobacterium paludis]